MDLSPIEQRVVGALVEKQMTTPEHYPLTTNALVAAANQASNRDPVTDYAETEVLDAVTSLRDRDLVRSVKRPGDRVMKHRHDVDRHLRLDDEELAVLAVLLLRGPQTPGEVRARTERYTDFTTGIEAALERLAGRDEPIVAALPRRPGQKEARWAHRLGAAVAAEDGPPDTEAGSRPPEVPDRVEGLTARLEALEASVAELRRELGL